MCCCDVVGPLLTDSEYDFLDRIIPNRKCDDFDYVKFRNVIAGSYNKSLNKVVIRVLVLALTFIVQAPI